MAMREEPLRLRGAQREIRDAFAASDAGLFTMDCVAGAGKSVVAHRIAAEDVLRRYVDGDPTPEQGIAVVSFTTDEAADIVPSVCEHLRDAVAHDLIPEASAVSEAEADALVSRVRRAPLFGTIDALLRGVFEDVAPAVGFESVPAVGNEALLSRVHGECYEAVASRPELAPRVERLETAYPDGEYDEGVAALLARALDYCRDRRLSTAAFERDLHRTREAAYPEGRTESLDDIAATIAGYAGVDSGADPTATLDDADAARLVAADRELHDAWGESIETFCVVLDAYRAAYRERIRSVGVASHTDVAFLVASYLDDDLPGDAVRARGLDDADATRRRTRLLDRYRSRLESVVVDEAQDVDAVQHDALSRLVAPDARVFAAGDTLQSIYRWRHADPSLFATACRDGQYLGIDWETHVSVTAATTYRCRPGIAAAVNRVVGPVFADPTRGAAGTVDAEFPGLEADRDPVAEPTVHVASFAPPAPPGTAGWANPDGRAGEANVLATYLARGLADGTFTDADGEPLSITVLFRRRARMSDYEAAFAEEGLAVWNASESLFDCPTVETVLAVCDWLCDPADPARADALLSTLSTDCDALRDALERNGGDVDEALAADRSMPRDQRALAEGLRRLRRDRDRFRTVPPAVFVEDIVEALALRADPHGYVSDVPAARRVANLDAFVEAVDGWTGDDRYAPAEFVALLDPFRETPRNGPTQPSAGADHDVVFRTIHGAKGDQDEVVALADPAPDNWWHGVQTDRLVTQGGVAGLAPPTHTDTATGLPLPPFDGGLYDPEGRDFPYRDVGLRWGTERWVADERGDAGGDESGGGDESAGRRRLLGPDRLERVVAESRAESWRLLYVALSRASEHLLVPLPDPLPSPRRPRDRWLEALADALTPADGSTPVDGPADPSLDVAVNGVDLFADFEGTGPTRTPHAGAVPLDRDALAPWVPRFLDPSTAYPLTEDADAAALRHLLDEPIHTETDAVAPSLPLAFDALGPDAIGTCLHDAITRLLAGDASAAAVRSAGEPVRRALDDAVDAVAAERGESVSDAERDGIVAFFASFVAEDLVDSALWDRAGDAREVYVEHDLSGLVRADNLEAEIHGTADLLFRLGEGEWQVTDVKISLTDDTEHTRSRYDLQVAAYAAVLERELGEGATVRRSVETFGVARDTVRGRIPPAVVGRRLRALSRRTRD